VVTCATPPATAPSASWLENLKSTLSARALVLVKFPNAGKRRAVEEMGAELVHLIEGVEIVQVVGHTALLFQPSAAAAAGGTEVERLLRLELAREGGV